MAGIRTCRGFSPRQLFISGILDAHNSTYSAVENIYSADNDNTAYGVDDSDEVEIETDNNVQVPPLEFDVSDENFATVRHLVDPQAEDGNNGVDHFLQVINFISNRHA